MTTLQRLRDGADLFDDVPDRVTLKDGAKVNDDEATTTDERNAA